MQGVNKFLPRRVCVYTPAIKFVCNDAVEMKSSFLFQFVHIVMIVGEAQAKTPFHGLIAISIRNALDTQ